MFRGLKRRFFPPASESYVVLTAEADAQATTGWLTRAVAERQDQAYRPLLSEMYAGHPRQDLRVAADAITQTGLGDPRVLEVGCGSGYYSEILKHLVGDSLVYVGVDYSEAMIELARHNYPDSEFVVGDAAHLPFDDASFDIVLNGASLMHIAQFKEAVRESGRVASRWCIFHTVPVVTSLPTTALTKRAYGGTVLEFVFNAGELLDAFAQAGLSVTRQYHSVEYDLEAVLGEPTQSLTYLCSVSR